MGFRNLHYINSGEHLLQMQVMREGLLLTYARIPWGKSYSTKNERYNKPGQNDLDASKLEAAGDTA